MKRYMLSVGIICFPSLALAESVKLFECADNATCTVNCKDIVTTNDITEVTDVTGNVYAVTGGGFLLIYGKHFRGGNPDRDRVNFAVAATNRLVCEVTQK
jgi:hypothetical protein